MVLLRSSCILFLVWVVVADPTTLVLKQTVKVTDAGTVGGPIFIGAKSDNGIVASSDSNLTYWRKNSSGIYTLS